MLEASGIANGWHRQKRGATAYIERGEGEVLVLVHGVGLNAAAWGPQIEQFAQSHRVIAIDMLGHGESAAPAAGASLADYVEQIRQLLDDLSIGSANVVGHSMGGLVAIGFALAHPSRCLRLGVFNSVYERDSARRAAVESRAAEIVQSGTLGNVAQPIERWFGHDVHSPMAELVRNWLLAMDPQSYAVAYRLFATSDRAFSGKLGNLKMPALFATGELDPNSTPEMAKAMAEATPGAELAVLPGQRHMMTLASPQTSNELIARLLARKPALDARELRKAFGTFMTGVTVVTTQGAEGPRGFTANSFTSVSLDPPLLLICIAKSAASLESFTKADGFAVNILSEQQKEVSGIFASKRADKFESVRWEKGPLGNPLIEDSVAWFDCQREQIVDAGDHVILIGRIGAFAQSDRNPLGYARGGYVTLGLEQAAVNAAAQGDRTVIGAILELAGKLLLRADGKGGYGLPEIAGGRVSTLVESMARAGLTTELSFLYAVFENPHTRVQSIYYRGSAQGLPAAPHELFGFEALPFEKIGDEAIRLMLKRYAEERKVGRYKIYSGDHERGQVKAVD